MKICFLSFEYPPFIYGGAGVYAKHITEELAELGHDIHVITSGADDCANSLKGKNLSVHRIPLVNKRFLKAASFWANLALRYNDIRNDIGGFEILHSNSISDLSLPKRQVREPRIVTVHHLALSASRRISFKDKLLKLEGETYLTTIFERIVLNRATKLIAVSNFTKNDLVCSYRVPPSSIEVIYNGVKSEDYICTPESILKIKKRLNLEKCMTFLSVGRIDDKRKGLPLLLHAFKTVFEKEHNVKLLIVGSGNPEYLRQLSKRLNLEKRIVFTGYLNDYSLRSVYCACDIFVSPSLLEGFGLNLIEAMASGKPVIAFKTGAVPEIMSDRINGKIVHDISSTALAEAMLFFLRNRELAEEIGFRNKTYVNDKFSWKKAAKKTLELYENVISHS